MSRDPTNYTRTRGPKERNLQETQFTHLCCQRSGCKDNRATENTYNETKTQNVELRVRTSAAGSREEGCGRDLHEEQAQANGRDGGQGGQLACEEPHAPPRSSRASHIVPPPPWEHVTERGSQRGGHIPIGHAAGAFGALLQSSKPKNPLTVPPFSQIRSSTGQSQRQAILDEIITQTPTALSTEHIHTAATHLTTAEPQAVCADMHLWVRQGEVNATAVQHAPGDLG